MMHVGFVHLFLYICTVIYMSNEILEILASLLSNILGQCMLLTLYKSSSFSVLVIMAMTGLTYYFYFPFQILHAMNILNCCACITSSFANFTL